MSKDAPKTDLQFFEQFEPDVFWEEHGPKIMTGLLIVILIGLGIFLWQRRAAEQELEASAQLAAAKEIADFEEVIARYQGRPAALVAELKLADLHFERGDYAAAARSYQGFLQKNPQHSLVPLAQLGMAAVQEAQGDCVGARKQYELLTQAASAGFAAVSARMGIARCAEMQGNLTEARQVYQEIMALAQRTPLYNVAMMRWLALGREVGEPVAGSESVE